MALTADRNVDEKEGRLHYQKQSASKIFHNALVKINAAGFVAPCSPEAGSNFAGVAYEGSDNSAGAAGAKSLRVIPLGTFLLPTTGAAQANVGDTVYATDDELVTLTEGTGSKQKVGVIVAVESATQVWVRLTPYAGVGAA